MPRLGVAAAVALCLALAGCGGDVSPAGGGDRVLETGEPRFDQQRVTWAHLRTLHYGEQELSLDHRAEQLSVSSYGFFVEQADGRDTMTEVAERSWFFVDEDGAQELPGDVSHVRTSADGRYAGWIDRDGPLRPAGRIAEVVVVDLTTGQVVLTDHSGMGGELGDDLGDRYEELPPTFLGFDARAQHAYWYDAEGSGTRKRADLETGEVEVATPDELEEFPGEEAVGVVVDAYRGRQAGPEPVSGPVDLDYGLYSPDERFAVDISRPGAAVAYDAGTGRRIRVDYPTRASYFGGWLPGDRFFVVSTAERIESYSTTGPDPTSGRIAVCSLPVGSCQAGPDVPGMRDVRVPGTQSLLG